MYCYFIINIILLIDFYNSYELSNEKKKALEELIQSGIKNAKLHSFGIVITNSSSTIFSKMIGKNNDITEKTPFIIGSVTKTFTALSIYKEKTGKQYESDNATILEWMRKDGISID